MPKAVKKPGKKKQAVPTAAVLLIGNEILSGRTQDSNLTYLAKELSSMGISLRESRVVPDVPKDIIEAVNALRKKYDYVFTTGGIGPTHDDITTECIAKAFKVKVARNKEAFKRLEKHYAGTSQPFNAARQKMANIPLTATLIDNPISAAPGYKIGNVYVMAGVPVIMRAMFDFIRGGLRKGKPVLSKNIATNLTEGTIATELGKIQLRFKTVDIGSYPHIRDGKLGVVLVIRGSDKKVINATATAIAALIQKHDGKIIGE